MTGNAQVLLTRLSFAIENLPVKRGQFFRRRNTDLYIEQLSVVLVLLKRSGLLTGARIELHQVGIGWFIERIQDQQALGIVQRSIEILFGAKVTYQGFQHTRLLHL